MAAVFDCPEHLRVIEVVSKAQRLEVAGVGCLDGALVNLSAGLAVDGHQCVGALVNVHPDHDHCGFPSLSLAKRTAAGQISLGAMPRSYQVTASVLGRRRATQRTEVRPGTGRHRYEESARRRSREPTSHVGRLRPALSSLTVRPL
jgi:hypothetical protein